MKDIVVPPDARKFEERLTCHVCGTSFVAEADDLDADTFKQPGTYWFDGSAQAAGSVLHFFARCPNDCGIVFVTGEVPPLLRRELLATAGVTA